MSLNADEKRELLRLIEADQPLPAHWRARLFPGSAQALEVGKEYRLEYAGEALAQQHCIQLPEAGTHLWRHGYG